MSYEKGLRSLYKEKVIGLDIEDHRKLKHISADTGVSMKRILMLLIENVESEDVVKMIENRLVKK